MLPALRLALICPLLMLPALTACAPVGAPPVPARAMPPLPEDMLRPCARPTDFLTGSPALTRSGVEILAGRLGDALIDCGNEKHALAAWAAGVTADLAGN